MPSLKVASLRTRRRRRGVGSSGGGSLFRDVRGMAGAPPTLRVGTPRPCDRCLDLSCAAAPTPPEEPTPRRRHAWRAALFWGWHVAMLFSRRRTNSLVCAACTHCVSHHGTQDGNAAVQDGSRRRRSRGDGVAGLPLVLETMRTLGVSEQLDVQLGIRQRNGGATDAQKAEALILLLAAGAHASVTSTGHHRARSRCRAEGAWRKKAPQRSIQREDRSVSLRAAVLQRAQRHEAARAPTPDGDGATQAIALRALHARGSHHVARRLACDEDRSVRREARRPHGQPTPTRPARGGVAAADSTRYAFCRWTSASTGARDPPTRVPASESWLGVRATGAKKPPTAQQEPCCGIGVARGGKPHLA